ncbi:signal peptidase I [Enterococcus sp. 7F3_DIV0205]|uniref:Signal peptidase I n=1 Tax=Candidatus Enterococcus palustris TaxID=1834189 RepID=A0AAQ3W595_9ENTE|nr:signal peptidase I [Enterococcus sp. 7F3_DIV0205]OTN84551.1 hypothetical protein A5821_000479 [Enterococcus sp. 7F3_DIV0205]
MKQRITTSKKELSNKKRKVKSNQTNQEQQKRRKKSTAITSRDDQSTSKKKRRKPSKTVLSKKKKRMVKRRKKQRRQFYQEIGVSFFLLLLFFVLFQWVFFSLPKVNGYGMTTTLDDGDRLFVSKRSQIKRFDLVYLRQPDTKQVMVRRVIGLPNEEVAYENDQLLIDKKPVIERYLKAEISEAVKENRLLTENFTLTGLTNARTLPENSYFVLGDNRHYAADSREFGWIEKKDILGVVKARIMPFHHMTQF